MLTGQVLLERIQKNVGVPWQSQRPDGFSHGILPGSADTSVSSIVTTCTPTPEIFRPGRVPQEHHHPLRRVRILKELVCGSEPTGAS